MTRTAVTTPSIVEFCEDPQLLGLSVSPAQRTLLKAIYGLALDEDERDLWRACTARDTYPARPFPEATIVAGARAGKDSRVGAPVVLFEALFGGHEHRVAKGETGTIVLVAQDAKAVGVAFTYIREYLQRSPVLTGFLDGEPLANSLRLRNGLVIQCFPCTLRSMRGYSIPCGVMDELAFFRLEGSADSDVEIQASIRRGMIAFPATRLIKISTPYLKGGVLFEDFTRSFGQADPDLLVWRAPSLVMNPSLRAERLDRERRLDPVRFAREYEAEFAEDVETFLPGAWVESAVQTGRHELPPQPGVRYLATCDPSGGGDCAMTACVVHADGRGAERRVVHDVCKGWAKPRGGSVDLEGIVAEIAAIVKRYGCATIHGDRYAGQWVKEAFRRHAITYSDATIRKQGESEPSYLTKSDAALEAEPLFAQGAITLLDHPQLIRELKNLERRPRAGGRAQIDHPRGQRDDFATALVLGAAMAGQGRLRPVVIVPGIPRIGEPAPHLGVSQPQHVQRGVVGGQARFVAGWSRSRWYR